MNIWLWMMVAVGIIACVGVAAYFLTTLDKSNSETRDFIAPERRDSACTCNDDPQLAPCELHDATMLW